MVDMIAETGAMTKTDTGKVVAVMPEVKGKADGNKVSQLVQQRLS